MMKTSPSRIFWYCILPTLCLAPDLLTDTFYLPDGSPRPVQAFTLFLYHAWGIGSLWRYWTLTKPQSKKLGKISDNSFDLTVDDEAV